MWELDHKESWVPNGYFWTVVLEKTLESPLDCKEIPPVHPKGYMRLLIVLPAILIPACASSSTAFLMMYSAYKLNKQGGNIQLWRTIWNQSVDPCPVLTVASWPAYRFLREGQVVWYSHLLKNFPVCCDPHNQRLWHNQQSRNRYFSGTPLLFLWSNRCWQFDLWFLCLF